MIINLSRDDATVMIDALTCQARAYDEMEYAKGAIATYRIRNTIRRLLKNTIRRSRRKQDRLRRQGSLCSYCARGISR